MNDRGPTYEFLTADTAVDYVRARPELAARIDVDAVTRVQEVGDGNLNLVFILGDAAGRGLVLKQALPWVRLVGPDWPMTPERARHEADATITHGRLSPGSVPEIFGFDPERFVVAMEDLSDHRVWRGALNEGLRHEGVAEAMGRYVAAVAFGTSVLGMDPEAQKALAAQASNPELCTITEDLVFTEPYVDAGRNSVLPENESDAAELAADAEMVHEMGIAKWTFMTEAEALIHGDLHTGSVMVRAGIGDGDHASAKAIDSEFAFYGPVAFDLGALWGNYVIAATRAAALGDSAHLAWCLDQAPRTWQAFEAEFRRRWPDRLDPRVFTDSLQERLLAHWREDTWLFAAAKMARRIVGLAKTSDIETLEPGVRVGAARAVLQMARVAVRERHVDSTAEHYVAVAGDVLAE
jgi:5-methylthioribose kinase